MKTPIRTLAITAVSAAAALSMSVGPAFAFHCYNASRSDQGNESGANGAQWSLSEALVAFCGVAPEDVPTVTAGLEAEGYRTDVLINFNALMAGGLERNGKGELLGDEQGIDHFDEAFFGTLFGLAASVGGDCEEE
jgi:hypothetical protein